MPANSRRNSS